MGITSIATREPSKKQAEILQFIRGFQKGKGYPPTLRDIADFFSISIPTVHEHIVYLRRKGLLSVAKGKRRSIRPLNDRSRDVVIVPLLGRIAAGGPIEAVSNPVPIEVPKSLLSGSAKHYALQITGTSMIEEGISDGDIVIVRQQQSVEQGEKAVAYIPSKDAVTLKKIFKENSRVKLVPANKYMKPFYETNVVVQGKVVGVIRKE